MRCSSSSSIEIRLSVPQRRLIAHRRSRYDGHARAPIAKRTPMALPPTELNGRRILVTGPTGQVALPVVAAYAKIAEVFALARFHRDEDAARIRALGAVPIK